MGDQKPLELRTRDIHHGTSIPTPVSSTSSTPTFQGIKRKFEEPSHLDLSDQTREGEVELRESRSQSTQSSQASPDPEQSSLTSSQANHSGSEMSFIIYPFSFVFGKISAFTEEILNQFKPSSSSPESRTELEDSQEPAQEPTPAPTPEPTLEPTSKSISNPTRDDKGPIAELHAPKPSSSEHHANPEATLKKKIVIRPKGKAFATLKETLARRDAPKRKQYEWPMVANRDQARRDHRKRIANATGSPFPSTRPRFDSRRQSRQGHRPAVKDPQFEEARRAWRQDEESFNAYIAALVPDRDGFKRYDLIVKERADREAEIQRLREAQKEPIVKPLSQATLAEVHKIITNRQKGKVLIEHSKARVMIYVDDMWRLNPFPPHNDPLISGSHTLWLNDAIIDLYLYMVAERANAKSESKKVHACTTFFWSLLLKNGPKKVENITRKAKIGGNNFLRLQLFLVPINFDNCHWALGVIKPAEKRIEFYDSWRSGARRRAQSFFKNIRDYLVNELKDKIKIDKSWDEWWKEWEDCFIEDCPSQNNAYDCGVFTCKHAEVIARGRELSFTQADMPIIRYRMVAELMKGELGVD